MKWLGVLVLLVALWAGTALGQFYPGSSPFVPDAPAGDNSNQIANTRWVNWAINRVSCTLNIDCSATVQAWLAPVNGVYPNVRIPAGTWFFQNPVTLAGGQRLYCDGWGNTTLSRDHTFSSSAQGWFILTGAEQNSPTFDDCDFTEEQPSAPTAQLTNATISGTSLTATIASGTPANGNLIYDSNTPAGNSVAGGQTLSAVSIVGSSLTATVSISQSIGPESMTTGLGRTQAVSLGSCTGANLCAYSPVIYNASSNRFHLYNLRFNHTWDCIVSPGQAGVFFIENIQNGCLDDGISMGSSGDISHIINFHTWNFGDSGPLFALFVDGGGHAGNFGTSGAVSGLQILDWFSYNKHTLFTGDSTSSMKMVAPFFDSGASLTVANGQHINLIAPTFDGHPSNGLCQLNISGGLVEATDLVMFSTNLSAYTTQSQSICTSHGAAASHLNVTGGRIAATATNLTLVTIAGTNSSADFNGVYFRTTDAGSGAWTNPVISFSADSGVGAQFINNRTDAAP